MRTTLLALLLASPLVLAQAPATPAAPAVALPPPEAAEVQALVPLAEIQRFVAVFRAIRQAYVEPISDKELMRAAIRGLLLDLDPHSAYLEKKDADALRETASGAYDGIGVEIQQRIDRSLVVVAPLDGAPAARAGIRPGDMILAIDGQPVDTRHSDEASLKLRGKPGTKVVLTVLGADDTAPRDLVIIRETIRVTSVSSRLLEPGYAYLRLSTFQADTGPQLNRQLAELRRKSDGNLRGIVIDLRSNPGGLLNAAVEAADAFLEQGVIVTTKGRLSLVNAQYRARAGDASAGAALVVLVDSGTASAAEVLAGALRDHKRAVLMGSRTFGKGSVQTVVPLENGDSVKLTTARYYLPGGKSIQASGLRPDVVVRGKPTRGQREQNLPRALDAGDGSLEAFALGEIIEGDAVIAEALARLKRGAPPTAATAPGPQAVRTVR